MRKKRVNTRADIGVEFTQDRNKYINLLDVVVTHPKLNDPNAQQPGQPASLSNALKDTHYKNIFGNRITEIVHPIAIETYGRLSPRGKKTLRDIVTQIGKTSYNNQQIPPKRIPKDLAFPYLMEQIQIALARSHYHSVVNYIRKSTNITLAHRPSWLFPTKSVTRNFAPPKVGTFL